MKQARTKESLYEAATMLKRNALDIVAPLNQLVMSRDMRTLTAGDHVGNLTPHAFAQLCRHVDVPVDYAVRCRDSEYTQGAEGSIINSTFSRAPLMAQQIANWLEHPVKNSMRLMRGIDPGEGRPVDWRAFLSNRYFPLDSFDLLAMVLKCCQDVEHRFGKVEWASGDINQNEMFVKLVFPGLRREVKRSARVGDVVQWGLYVENNEIGLGRWKLKGFVEFLVCTNGMVSSRVVTDREGNPLVTDKRHVGATLPLEVDSGIQWGDEVYAAAKQLQMNMIEDTIGHLLQPDKLEAEVAVFDRAAGSTQSSNLEVTVQRLAETTKKTIGMSDFEQRLVFNKFFSDGDRSQFGLSQAICSQEVARGLDYARATQFEQLAYNVIALPERQWSTLAVAA